MRNLKVELRTVHASSSGAAIRIESSQIYTCELDWDSALGLQCDATSRITQAIIRTATNLATPIQLPKDFYGEIFCAGAWLVDTSQCTTNRSDLFGDGCGGNRAQRAAGGPVAQWVTQQGSPALSATLRVLSDWQTDFCADITLTNTTETLVDGWHLAIDLTDAAITSSWNADYTPRGDGVVDVTPLPDGQLIYPSSSLSTGFCATKLGPNYTPEIIDVQASGSP